MKNTGYEIHAPSDINQASDNSWTEQRESQMFFQQCNTYFSFFWCVPGAVSPPSVVSLICLPAVSFFLPPFVHCIVGELCLSTLKNYLKKKKFFWCSAYWLFWVYCWVCHCVPLKHRDLTCCLSFGLVPPDLCRVVIGSGAAAGRGLSGTANLGDYGADDPWRSQEPPALAAQGSKQLLLTRTHEYTPQYIRCLSLTVKKSTWFVPHRVSSKSLTCKTLKSINSD